MVGVLPGCRAAVYTEPAATVIQWAPGLRILAIAVPIVCAAIGILLLRSKRQRANGWVALVVAVIAAAVGAVVYADEIVITQEEIYDHHGFPWNRTKRGFRFEDVTRVTFQEVRERSGRSSTTDTHWHLQQSDGEVRTIDPGDLWGVALDTITAHLVRAGVRVGTDLSRFGMASDDPMVVTYAGGLTYRFDSDSPSERFAALWQSGAFWKMVSAADGSPLRAVRDTGRPPLGRWTYEVADGPRTLTLALEFFRDGTLRSEASNERGPQAQAGRYRWQPGELLVEFDGSSMQLSY